MRPARPWTWLRQEKPGATRAPPGRPCRGDQDAVGQGHAHVVVAVLVAERAGHAAAARVELLDLEARARAAGPRACPPCRPGPSAGNGRAAGRGLPLGSSGSSGTRPGRRRTRRPAARPRRPRRRRGRAGSRGTRRRASAGSSARSRRSGCPACAAGSSFADIRRGPGRGPAARGPSRSPAGRSRPGPASSTR